MTVIESSTTATAERFLAALRCRDFAGLAACIDGAVRFRALIPPGLREAADPQSAAAYFANWFGGADYFELTQSQIEPIADRIRLSYRMRLHDGQGWHLAEQQLFCDVDADCITRMDLLCSGFRS